MTLTIERLRALTPDKLAAERNSIVDAEARLGTHCETILLLVEPNVADLVGASRSVASH